MKKPILLLFAGLLLALHGYTQNAFYDAQGLASLTQKEQAAINGAYDQTQFSDEENQTVANLRKFLANPTDNSINRDLLNTKVIKQILSKLSLIADRAAGNHNAYTNASGFNDLDGSAQSTLTGLGNSISRLGTSDYESMLIDATAKYLAESFKEDMTYRYFRLLKDKIDATPMIKDLFPLTCAAVEKIDPFNFKDLGNSWKAAFEKDIQNLPIAVSVFVKNNQNITWCKNVNASSYFKYYSYSTDILEPLIKGEHPVEILKTLDQNYYGKPIKDDNDHYKAFIHFLNVFQRNLQDSTKNAKNQIGNVWISFDQLKTLNTTRKIQYFCALVYLDDSYFFDNDPFGIEIKKLLVTSTDDNKKVLISSLPNLLILLNQVEGGFAQIKSSRQNSTSPAITVSDTYIKQVLAIADSANSFLKQMKSIDAGITIFTDKVDLCLTYGNDAYAMYSDVVQKNYSGAIQQLVTLFQTIDTKGNISSNIIQTVIQAGKYTSSFDKVFTDFNAANGALSAHLSRDDFNTVIFNNIKLNAVDGIGFASDLKIKIAYDGIKDASIKAKIDSYLKTAMDDLAALNTQISSDPAVLQTNTYLKVISLVNKYGNVIAGVASATNSNDLETVIKNYVESSGTYVLQRTSLSTISLAAKVGFEGGFEGTDHFKSFSPNLGLSVPVGIEFTWGGKTTTKTDYPYLNSKNQIGYLNEKSTSLFVQIFDIAAVVNYRLGADSSSTLPQKITIQQIFSPGLTYNIGFKNAPFDLGFGGEFTPQLRKIGDNLQASTIRLFIRISWDKPLIFIHTNRQTKQDIDIGTSN